MGQYYVAMLEKNQKVRVISGIKDDWSGKKLTEQSWWRNPFVNTVCHEIHHKPTRVWWVGDYSNDVGFERYEEAWGEKTRRSKLAEAQVPLDDKFLVNHTEKTYLNCNTYYERSVDKNVWCLHPLPLLTAVGNGLGGGDYHSNIGVDYVGYWAGDVISVENNLDNFESYDEFEVTFKEV